MACLTVIAQAQSMQFPMQKYFDECNKPMITQSAMNAQTSAAYEEYKMRFIKESMSTVGGYYVESKDSLENWSVISSSEAHGVGMVIVTHMAGYDPNAKEIFDGMVRFYEERTTTLQGVNLMGAHVFGDVSAEKISANLTSEQKAANPNRTKGDVNIAYALLLAYRQWGDRTYKEKALAIIHDIKKYNIHPATKAVLIGSDASSPSSEAYEYTSPSSWLPGHYRTFADATGDQYWDEVADGVYEVYNMFQEVKGYKYGLVPDFLYYSGNEVHSAKADFFSPYSGAHPDKYYKNAASIPWSFTADFALTGGNDAKGALRVLQSFIDSKVGGLNYSSVKKGYNLTGESLNDDSLGGAEYLAPLVTAKITSSDIEGLTNGWNSLIRLTPRDVHESQIQILSMLLISGNWWHYDDSFPYIPGFDTLGVYLEDFADSEITQNAIAHGYGKYGDHNYDNYWDAGGFWYVYGNDDEGKVFNKTGQEINEDGSNTAEMFTGVGIEARLVKSGTIETDIISGRTLDLSEMTGVTVTASGSGEILVGFSAENDLTMELDDFSGMYYCKITLTEEMKSHKIISSLLIPEAYSIEHKAAYSWRGEGSKKVKSFRMRSADGNDVNLNLKSIKLNGSELTSESLGYPGETALIDTKSSGVALSEVKLHSGIVTARLNLLHLDKVRLEVINVHGRIISESDFSSTIGENVFSIDMNGYAAGLYFVNLRGAGITLTEKIILR